MIALWVYIKPKKFGFDIFNGSCKNNQKVKIRDNDPVGHSAAGKKKKYIPYAFPRLEGALS